MLNGEIIAFTLYFFAIIGVLVILIGLLIFVNTRQDTVQYSREELEELAYFASMVCRFRLKRSEHFG